MTYDPKLLVVALIVLQVKHVIIDWVLQPPWMWQNKGKLGHPGGLTHAGLNAWGTSAVLTYFFPLSGFLWIFIADFLAHYTIDYCKMNINRIKGWEATTHAEFWWLTGIDQFLHQVTYLVIIYKLL